MKKLLLLTLLITFYSLGYSQNFSINFSENKSNLNGIRVNQNDDQILNFSVNFQGIDIVNVKTKEGLYSQLLLQGSYRTGKIGHPELPSTKKIIEIPLGSNPKIKVINYNTSEYKLNEYGFNQQLIPLQPSYPKNVDPSQMDFIVNKEAYTKNSFVSYETATINKIGVLRGIELAQVSINPIQYNPAANSIRVLNNIEIEVSFEGVKETKSIKKRTNSPYFNTIYKNILNTKDNLSDHPDHTKYPIKYLIVSHPDFENQLADFVDWKTKKGFEVTMVTTDEIGSTSAEIKAWIHSQYNSGTETDPAPTFFLLVGDTDQVPPSQIGDDSDRATDLYYACVDGADDIIPDMYYGRFSAQNSTQLQNMLDKVLYYEKYEFAEPEYLNHVTLIAGADGTWNPRVGQPTINYGTENYFNTDKGFSTVNKYLNSYNGCYESDKIKVGFINYTAHCNETSWADPYLSKTAVNSFDNANKYPLAIGNCCLAADFGTNECIGETWMRKANGGAVAYIGSSPSSYWYEDFYWSVGAHQINFGEHPTFEGSTIGAYDAPYVSDYLCVDALIFVGNLAVTEAHDQNYPTDITIKYYWEAYNCLSDPSLFIYLTEGEENTVSHMPTLPIGVSEFEISAEPGSYVAISKDGTLYGTAIVPESGVANVSLTPITESGEVDIVVTKSQYKPYITTIPAATLDGPYLTIDQFIPIDQSGNGEVESGESFTIDLTLKNIGSLPAENIKATISSTDTNVILSNNTDIVFANINANETGKVSGKFEVITKQNIPDQHGVIFDVTITDDYSGKQEYISAKTIFINAPNPEVILVEYNDNFEGNDINGIIDAGETGEVTFTIENNGHVNYTDAKVYLGIVDETNNYLTLNTTMAEVGNIQVSSTITATFNITASEDTPLEEQIALSLLVADNTYAASDLTQIVIGEIPIYVMGEETLVNKCSGTFYDSGNENSGYSASENLTTTFKPNIEGNVLQFTFESFNVESGYDFLYVYNGLDANAEEITGSPFSGTNAPESIMASNADGALTFVFTSDSYTEGSGWVATFECIDATALPLCAENPSPVNEASDVNSSTTLSWDAVSGAIAYDIYFGETLPTEPNTTVSTNSYEVLNLNPYTTYEWHVVPKNIYGESPETNCSAWSFTTGKLLILMSNETITTCDAVFTDPSGFENYNNSEDFTQTILPGESGKVIQAEFTELNLEEDYDYIEIYDGISVDENTLIGKYDTSLYVIGTNGIVRATNEAGALTFKYHSDGLYNYSGWVANITCYTEEEENATINFKVTDSNGAVENATITINENQYTTNNEGVATILLSQATYAYTVSKENYITADGSFNAVPGMDTTINILLTGVGISDINSNEFKIYPNPNKGQFIVEGTNIKSISVVNTSGVTLLKKNYLESNVYEFDKLNQGIYFIKIISNNNSILTKKITVVN